MRTVSLAGVAAVISMAAIPAAAQDAAPGPDIHFTGEHGRIERGVRCATETLSPEMQEEVDRVLAAARESGQVNAAGDILVPVAFHVIHNGSEGNIPAAMINAQISVLNAAYAGRGFAFTLASIDRTNNGGWVHGVLRQRELQAGAGGGRTHNLNFYTCKPTGGILGYSYLPASFPEDNWHHGVVVLYSSLPGGTADPYNLGDAWTTPTTPAWTGSRTVRARE